MAAARADQRHLDRLKLKALAFRALAGPFGRGPSPDSEQGLSQAASCLELLGWRPAASEAGAAARAFLEDRETASLQHSRISHRAIPPPYETSYSPSGGANDLADIAGFYRAFGVQIEGDRPDHVAAELEYVAFMLIREAYARERGEQDNAAVCADARRSFVRDHAGCWLGAFAARVEESSPGRPYEHLARAAERAVAADAAEMGVVPRSSSAGGPLGDAWNIPGPAVSPDEPACAPAGDLTVFS